VSGGSFDYFYSRAPDVLKGYASDLGTMADACADRAAGPPEKHYKTGELIELAALAECGDFLRFLSTRMAGIARVLETTSDITHAVEWWKSCDYGAEQVIDAWRKAGKHEAVAPTGSKEQP
jgi:hypothetical protein